MGMTAFLHMHQIKIFKYPTFANNLRLELRDHAELIAKENNLEIELIRKVWWILQRSLYQRDSRITRPAAWTCPYVFGNGGTYKLQAMA